MKARIFGHVLDILFRFTASGSLQDSAVVDKKRNMQMSESRELSISVNNLPCFGRVCGYLVKQMTPSFFCFRLNILFYQKQTTAQTKRRLWKNKDCRRFLLGFA